MLLRYTLLLVCLGASVIISATAPAQTPTQERADVVVYGGTPAGIIAAIAAAREGAKVILVEPGNHLGGMVTGGLGATDQGNGDTVGGITREYFERIGKHYGAKGPGWRHEPAVASRVFDEMLAEAKVTIVRRQRLREKDGVAKDGARIARFTTESGTTYTAPVFIDATYEGDLLAKAGVKYVVGREGQSDYGESRAGVRRVIPLGQPGSGRDEKGVLPDILQGDAGKEGEGDRKIMSYNFRLCLTREPANRVPFAKPERYDPRRYAMLFPWLKVHPDAAFRDIITLTPVGNGKVDANNKPSVQQSTNLHNGSWGYPDGTYTDRARIWADHEDYLKGFLYFVSNDPRVPEKIRSEANQWGLAKDEFAETGHFPPQLYVRVGRRMIGEKVMIEQDLTTVMQQPDAVALGSYFMDSHRVQRVLLPNGDVATEGGVGGSVTPYEISYRSLMPKRTECTNLLVPQCMAATNVAWTSIRMEPVLMMMGHSAGVAAAMAAKGGTPVQDVPYADLEKKLLAQKQILSYASKPKPDAGVADAGEPEATRKGKLDAAAFEGIVIDDDDAEMTGLWTPGSHAQYLGSGYVHDGNDSKGQLSATFVPDIPAAGEYEVRLIFPPASNRATAVPVTIKHAEGAKTVSVNQRTLPKDQPSVVLGVFRFEAGKAGSVTVSNKDTKGHVVVDAVQFVPTGATPKVQARRYAPPEVIGMKYPPPEARKMPSFFPCFDEFGQYVHRDWPGKLKDERELGERGTEEQRDLAAHSGPADWNEYGGWAGGPQLKATGHFRTERHGERWWLVDPAGRLFFSHGVNCVRKSDPTPVDRREHYFKNLPLDDSAYAPFVAPTRATKGPYAGTSPTSFSFSWANLYRKYGPQWDARSGEVAQQRMRSWGLNTMGNWSHEPTYLLRKTPYTVNLGAGSRGLGGAPRNFRDPFDPAYPGALRERLDHEAGKSLDDPWCLGYFVDNELAWGEEHSLGEWTLLSNANQPAKAALLADLRAKYESVDRLNAAWGTHHASWEALLETNDAVPTTDASLGDLRAFHRRYAEQYFAATRQVLKSAAPNKLYLGCRIHVRNQGAREAAAKHCDVVSFNTYARTIDALPADLSAPIMVTEFSFGATDRGLFYAGIGNPAASQGERAMLYEKFVTSVIANPSFVGCHWFQYQDQPASGRTLEGENGQYGFVDIVDSPYPEMVAASRRVGAALYARLTGSR